MNGSETSSERLGPGRIAIYCLIFFGLAVTDQTSNQLLPLTVRRTTADPAMIGWILALNPLFGFIAHPLAGLWSDRVWTRLGRRAVFLIAFAPLVAGALLAIPWAGTLWSLVTTVVVLQFCQDILWGAHHPLLAELIPSWRRGLVAGLMAMTYQLGSVFVVRIGLPWVEAHERTHGGAQFGLPLYAAAAALQVVLVAGLAFFLWEKPPGSAVAPRIKLTPGRYVRDFAAQPGLLRLGWVQFGFAFQSTAALGFLVLFGTETLGASMTAYAGAMGWLPLIGFCYLWLIGLAADRWPRVRLATLGFAGCAVGCALGWQADSLASLAVAFVVLRFFSALVDINCKALIAECLPPGQEGQFAGAINIFFAAGRTLAFVVVGQAVAWGGGDYRIAWPIAFGAVAVNLWQMLAFKARMAGQSRYPSAVYR